MRRLLFVTSVMGAALAVSPLAAAQPPAGDSAVKVQAVYGPEQFALAGVKTDITPCAGGTALPSVTTGNDGTVTAAVPSGCYQIQIATPTGCALDGDASQQVNTVPGPAPLATFRFRCA
ncbi:hypothetical protein [Nocardia sp. NBC_01327]|uniref:hypothetical protein n=1 Tax=Nocardia sp. NBC_01327 TaxID=2903593 RepID=UPI002E0DA99A|nr:hypothetical protein OG326_08130 [Nocardia sp. NBC_01327]